MKVFLYIVLIIIAMRVVFPGSFEQKGQNISKPVEFVPFMRMPNKTIDEALAICSDTSKSACKYIEGCPNGPKCTYHCEENAMKACMKPMGYEPRI